MSTCPNCKTKLSCGCQKRTASDNTVVCTSCLAPYEAKIKSNVVVNNSPQITTPSNVTLIYNGPLSKV